jgi:preprotein translocase subunit YajC
MKIEDVRLGMSLVTSGGLHGQVAAITKEGGLWLEKAEEQSEVDAINTSREVKT